MPKRMGFWDLTKTKTQIREEVLSHVGITPREAEFVLEYMDASEPCEWWKGFAGCRICGQLLGTTDLQTPDGKWTFPEKWQHYITEHNIRPTDEQFTEDAQVRARKIRKRKKMHGRLLSDEEAAEVRKRLGIDEEPSGDNG